MPSDLALVHAGPSPAPALSALADAAVVAAPLPERLVDGIALGAALAERAAIVVVEWDVLVAPVFAAVCQAFRAPARLAAGACHRRDDVAAALVAGADWAAPLPADPTEYRAAWIAKRRALEGARFVCPEPPVAEVGAVRVDHRRKAVSVHRQDLLLTPRLYDLLVYLLGRHGETVSRADLLADVWGLDFDPETNVVDVYVHYLRRQLRPHGMDASLVTVRGRGYRLDLAA